MDLLQKITGVGLWTGSFDGLAPAAAGEAAAALEAQGWNTLWFGEAWGREAFTQAQLLLAATSTMTVATGIANIWVRDAMNSNSASRFLSALSGDRFLLGLGVSHQPLVQRLRGHDYGRPVAAMREYLAAMDAAPDAAPEGTGERTPRVLAALGPAMLALSASSADGAHPYLGTPEHTALARAAIGPTKLLAVELGVVLSADRSVFLRRAATHLNVYTGLPNYRNNWLRLGFEEADMGRGGSERLADGLLAYGTPDAIKARVQEHFDAGADHVCIQILGEGPFDPVLADAEILAPALIGMSRQPVPARR